ncbi:MFS transporter [Phenylobacterium sp.]|uniref:MFS transporter n=1 Tax=Phenylobacterium sp. TaxID=1871053 RepID=UPI002DF56505|nr:MFS transporter [Phenylobacterium sp.]
MAGGTSGATERISLWRAILFGLAGLPVAAAGTAFLIFLPPHLTSQLGVPLAVVGGSWALVRVIDIVVDPLLGILMDSTRTPFGRYRPWMVAAAPIFMLGLWMLFFAPVGITQVYLVGWLLVLYVALSILSLAHPAWGASLARGYDERSRIYGIMAAVAIASIVSVLVIPVVAGLMGADLSAVHAMGWYLVIATPLSIGVTVLATPETVNPNHRREPMRLADFPSILKKTDLLRLYAAQFAMTLGPGWMSSLFIFFTKDYMHFTTAQASELLVLYIAAGLGGAPATAKLAQRIGKHRTIMVVAAAYSLGLLTVLLPPKGVVLATAPVMLWCGFFGAGFDMTIRSMLADVSDEVRLEEGKERTSLIYALYTLAAKLANAFAIGLTFPLLQRLGYQPKLGLANSPEAIRSLGLTFVSGPIAFVVLGAACMIGWRLTADRHAEIRLALETRDAEAALGIDGEHIADAAAAAEAAAGA